MTEVTSADQCDHIASLDFHHDGSTLQILRALGLPLIVTAVCWSTHSAICAAINRAQLTVQLFFGSSLGVGVERRVNAQLACVDIFTQTLFDFLAHELREIRAERPLAMEAGCIARCAEFAFLSLDCFATGDEALLRHEIEHEVATRARTLRLAARVV